MVTSAVYLVNHLAYHAKSYCLFVSLLVYYFITTKAITGAWCLYSECTTPKGNFLFLSFFLFFCLYFTYLFIYDRDKDIER